MEFINSLHKSSLCTKVRMAPLNPFFRRSIYRQTNSFVVFLNQLLTRNARYFAFKVTCVMTGLQTVGALIMT